MSTISTATVASAGSTFVRPALRVAAVAYPVVWIAGLALTSGPALDAPAREIGDHYLRSAGPAGIQAVLVHGIAAVALLVVGVAVVRSARAVAPAWSRVAAAALGVSVVVSLVQMSLGLAASARGGDLSFSVDAFEAVNRLDAVKMLGIAVVVHVGVVLARRGAVARWLVPLGTTLAVLLVVSAVGYGLLVPALAVVAVAGLPLLLVWVCATGLSLSGR
jgi:hypothetical protein